MQKKTITKKIAKKNNTKPTDKKNLQKKNETLFYFFKIAKKNI